MTLDGLPGPEIVRDEPLSRHTYMRIGGPARFFATPASLDELDRLVEWARRAGLPLRMLGGGSNVLVSDAGVDALVISLRRACGELRFAGERVAVGAGVMLPALARAAAEHDLGGLEFAIGIPGALGGALQTNAGIGDGRCIGPLVEAVDVLDPTTGHRRTLDRAQLTFEYRTSSLRGSGLVVLEARLRLEPRPRAEVEAEMRRLLEARQRSQPTAEPNAGSMFRNPAGDYAGRLIEAAGCKGLAAGAASVSTLHANFIVHDGSASSADVLAVMSEVQRRVLGQFGVWLTPEVEWWGDGEPPGPFLPQP